jgi:hypothetical protein
MEKNKWIEVPSSAKISALIQKILIVVGIVVFFTLIIYEAGTSIQLVPIMFIMLLFAVIIAVAIFFRSDSVERFMFTDDGLTLLTRKSISSHILFSEMSEARLVLPAIMKSYTTVMIKTKSRKEHEDYYHQPIGKDGLPVKDALKAVAAISAGAAFKTGNAVTAGQRLMGDMPDIRFNVRAETGDSVKDYIVSHLSQ